MRRCTAGSEGIICRSDTEQSRSVLMETDMAESVLHYFLSWSKLFCAQLVFFWLGHPIFLILLFKNLSSLNVLITNATWLLVSTFHLAASHVVIDTSNHSCKGLRLFFFSLSWKQSYEYWIILAENSHFVWGLLRLRRSDWILCNTHTRLVLCVDVLRGNHTTSERLHQRKRKLASELKSV